MKLQRSSICQNSFLLMRMSSIVCLASLVVLGVVVSPASGRQAPPTTLQAAKTKHKEASDAYATARRLSAQGSVSQSRVRRARLERDLTALQVSSLSDPAIKSYNELLKAHVVYRFQKEEWKVAKRLYQKGSLSELAWSRAETAKEVAKLNLNALQASSQVKRQLKQIAAFGSRLAAARKEYETARRLHAVGSLSEAQFREVSQRLKKAEEAHRASKRSFGVRAVPLRI